jgi:hypothetical protein
VLNKPNLPTGTSKDFVERVNGEEHDVHWYKVSDFEVVIERPEERTRYLHDERGALIKVVQDGLEVVYDEPIPDLPYPLKEGDSWRYESNYTLNLVDEGRAFRGRVVIEEAVVGFDNVKALDGKVYLCAEMAYTYTDSLERDELLFTLVSRGREWVSSEVGLVKDEEVTSYYVNGIITSVESRSLVLKSIRR